MEEIEVLAGSGKFANISDLLKLVYKAKEAADILKAEIKRLEKGEDKHDN